MAAKNDRLALLRDYLDNDTQQIKEMLELFLKTLPSDLHELTVFCEKNDTENIRKTAHRIKSSVKLFGLNNVGDILQKMEFFNKKNTLPQQAKTLMKQVNQLMNQAFEQLREELASL